MKIHSVRVDLPLQIPFYIIYPGRGGGLNLQAALMFGNELAPAERFTDSGEGCFKRKPF